jgi:subtilisin
MPREHEKMSQPQGPARAGRPRGQPEREPAATRHNERDGIRVRPDRYLVAAIPSQPSAPGAADAASLIDRLDRDPDVALIRTIGAGQRLGGMDFPQVTVVEMAADRAAALAASPQVHVEIDQPLGYGDASITCTDPGAALLGEGVPVTFEVVDEQTQPVAGAAVLVLGEQLPVYGITDRDGRVSVAIPAEQVAGIRGVYVQAPECWSLWLTRPALDANEPNPLVCTRLDPVTVGSWSRRAMGFDRLPPTYLGHGVRLALLDSGVTTTTGGLSEHVVDGLDVLAQDSKSWVEDLTGWGTHAGGLIVATDEAATGRGLASEVELHVCKVTPGGRHSDLIEALDYCLTHDIDVVDLGVGSPYPSWLIAAKIEQARRAGIACVAGVGNGGPVSFPASLPGVLAVAAIGQLGTFPPDSYHATQLAGPPSPDGYFSAGTSTIGPPPDVCAPGVAIISTTPTGGLAARDGSSVAAAHVAALAALVLAHHPEFRNGYRVRGAARVDRLHQIIRASCRPVGDPHRTGGGLPDAVAAVGLVSNPPYAPAPVVLSPWSAITTGRFTPAATTGPTDLPSTAGPFAPTADAPLTPLRTAMRSAGLATAERPGKID